ncbi:EAL domain-containing protein [Methylomonas sp. LL1]|uniref:two-component system response regulator n=1 Tax=Methylomonas sp. LL1 TaxID=2785785 RepID=UPI0018C41BED|nr:EAL domain-containing protein [Methylomonas sp. LL1]QPK64771.1 EAL domain-containing protein [Methylomonas sp. LL1]
MMIEKPKILVVDDIPANLVAMRSLLKRLPCDLVEASSGNQALGFSIEHDFALILLDVDMPGMDGYEVARWLKEEPSTQHIPIIFVTASYEDQQHRLRGYQAGAVDYIQKPVDDVILLSKAGIFLDLYNNRQLAKRELARSEAMRIASTENEARFRQALIDAPIPIMLHAEDGEVILLSRVWTELTGYRQSDIPRVQDWLRKGYCESNADNIPCGIDRRFAKDAWAAFGEYKVRAADGNCLTWIFRSGTLAPLPDGRSLVVTMAADLTERKRAEDQLRLASLVFQNSSEGMTVTDADGTIVSVNPAFTELTGYTAAEVMGKNPRILKSGRHDADFYRAMWDDLNHKGSWQGEIWNRRKDGTIYAEWLSINSIFNDDGSVQRRVALFSDITKRKLDEELIWQQANFDPLTGLSNRRMFHDRLAQQIKESHRNDSCMALIYLDLDEFKNVNDSLGHDMGDILLKEAAQRLLHCVRETDTVSRLGGDEFTIIVGDLEDYSKVERIAQEIIEKLSEPYVLADEVAHVSASVGITLYPDDALDFDTLLKNADQAMYAAKNQGRRRYCYFTPAMQEATLQRMRIVNDLREALANRQFYLHYQPIVELASGKTYKAEALVRWQHPVRGAIGPDEFIPIAEETGTIVEIGDWVFREAASQVVRWRAMFDPAFQVSVNKSPVQFRSNSANHIAWLELLRNLGLPGDSIAVEITEGLLLDVNIKINNKLLAFRNANIQMSIDDFGTGYSALSYLQKFDIDFLKIDRAFVCNLESDPKNKSLCTAIIVMAHELGLKVVAEGVETEAQREFLLAAKCDFGQGYLFSRPLAADEFENWINSQ